MIAIPLVRPALRRKLMPYTELMTKQKESQFDTATLYPRPKTYEELKDDRKRIDAKKIARQPKRIIARIVLQLTFVFAYILWFITMFPVLMYGGLAGVCACFLLGILLYGILLLTKSNIERLSEIKNGSSSNLLIALSFMCGLPLVYVGTLSLEQGGILIGLIITYGLVIWLVTSTLYSARVSTTVKLLLLILIFTLVITGSTLIATLL